MSMGGFFYRHNDVAALDLPEGGKLPPLTMSKPTKELELDGIYKPSMSTIYRDMVKPVPRPEDYPYLAPKELHEQPKIPYIPSVKGLKGGPSTFEAPGLWTAGPMAEPKILSSGGALGYRYNDTSLPTNDNLEHALAKRQQDQAELKAIYDPSWTTDYRDMSRGGIPRSVAGTEKLKRAASTA